MMNNIIFLVVFSVAFLVSSISTPLLRRVALRTNILSRPGKRRIHKRPIPYLGGIAIYISFVISILLILYVRPSFRQDVFHKLEGLLVGGTLVAILGLWDDIKNIRPSIKLFTQFIVALLLFRYGLKIELLTNPFLGDQFRLPILFSIALSTLWIIGIMNAVNLIDGLDGLAAGIVAIVSGSLVLVAIYLNYSLDALLHLALIGSVLGFLRYNFHPAKIFMGDSGSLFIGYVLACVTLFESHYKASTAVALLVPLTALAIPLSDTIMAVFRRLLLKGSIFKADKNHLHHRLLNIGLNQRQIVLFLYLVTLYLGIFSFLFVLIPERFALILLILLGLGLFLGVRIMGFVERKVRLLHQLEFKEGENGL